MNIFSLCNLFKRILCRFLYLAACVLLHTELIRGAQCLCLSIVLSGERTGPWFAVVVYIALVNIKYIAERELLEYYTERRTATHLRSINKINFPRFYQEEENKQSGKSKYKHMIYFNRHVKKNKLHLHSSPIYDSLSWTLIGCCHVLPPFKFPARKIRYDSSLDISPCDLLRIRRS